MIDSMYQPGSDMALDDRTLRPLPAMADPSWIERHDWVVTALFFVALMAVIALCWRRLQPIAGRHPVERLGTLAITGALPFLASWALRSLTVDSSLWLSIASAARAAWHNPSGSFGMGWALWVFVAGFLLRAAALPIARWVFAGRRRL